MIVTLDGPVASGKSTAAKNLARALGFDHLDSGAIYRAITLLASRHKTDTSDAAAVRKLLTAADVRLDKDKVFLNGTEVSDAIRRPEISAAVRPLAENPDVREFVESLEHRLSADRNIVVEGRDMGTVVFPDAEVKIYLTASPEERARRRCEELKTRGTPQSFDTVLADLVARDSADMSRALAPLRKADGAIEVDNTGLEPEETLSKLVAVVQTAVQSRGR